MSKFDQYNIVLKDLKVGESQSLQFNLDNSYFKKIDSEEVKVGEVIAKVNVLRKNEIFELKFELNGYVSIPCDRCLDPMNQNITHKEKLLVKFGSSFSEENDIVIVPESEGAINIAWFLYEFTILNIPIKHVHPNGECNKTMVVKLKKHITHHRSEDDDDSETDFDEFENDDFISNDTQIDPRWDSLKNISENN